MDDNTTQLNSDMVFSRGGQSIVGLMTAGAF